MTRAPNWNDEELELVLTQHQLSSTELAQRLQRRTPDAVEVVREGIHSYHLGRNLSLLSKLLLRRLEEADRQLLTCAICQTRF